MNSHKHVKQNTTSNNKQTLSVSKTDLEFGKFNFCKGCGGRMERKKHGGINYVHEEEECWHKWMLERSNEKRKERKDGWMEMKRK